VKFFLFLGASFCYVPVVVYLLLHYWQLLLDRITSPGSRRRSPEHCGSRYTSRASKDPEENQAEKWERIQAQMELLSADPTNVAAHERLGDIYVSMGFHESALYEYKKAADWLGRGYAQSHMLYKAAHILVEKKKDIPAALILLRRIVRLYPKSCFASYARRV